MSPRGGGERSAEDREAARRARERRRYERSGEPIPEHLLEPGERAAAAPPAFEPEPDFAAPAEPAPEPEPFAFDEPAAAHEPPAPPAPHEPEPVESSPFDAFLSQPDERTAAHEPAAAQPHDEPAAPADPPLPPPVSLPREELQETQQWDVTRDWTGEHGTVPDPSTPPPVEGEREAPLGTRRVSSRHLPHIHRPTRGGGKRRGGDLPRRGRGVRVKRPGEMAAGSSRRRSAGPRIVAGVVVVLVIVGVWFLNSIFQPFGGGGDGSGNVTVKIPQGASSGEIADLLEARGVIASSFFFGLRASVDGERSKLKSGTYRLRRDMSYGAALSALTKVEEKAVVPTISVAIPEGRSRRETVAIARRAGLRGDYLTASRRSRDLDPVRYGAPRDATLEGFLFPATYELNKGAKVQRLVADQLRAFKQNFATIDLGYARSKRLTAFDVLTIASMVEREVSVASERPLVAAVIYNRLRDGIPLGIDATLRFEQNDWVNPLKQSTIDADTPYNTRIRQGLPPGPIGSPGLASIKAAARPANSRALYYVVKPGTCGEHAFSDSFERFQADVAKYNQAREAAGGKSPTRC